MRKWFKYTIAPVEKNETHQSANDFWDEYSKEGLIANAEYYKDKKAFFRKYFFNYHYHRLEFYDDYLRKHISKNQEILSLGSGRSANELFLNEDGYRICCSDIEEYPVYAAIRRIFKNFNFMRFNILESAAHREFDAIIALSLIYLFDKSNLRLFMRNVSDSLKVGGELHLDSAGSPDNLMSYLLNEVYLKYRCLPAILFAFLRTGKRHKSVANLHGFKYKDSEIIDAAREYGLRLEYKQNYAFMTELRRIGWLDRLIKPDSSMEKPFLAIGRLMPYIRMFTFRKVR